MIRKLIFFHGLYYVITGLWALFDIDSFQRVTGPKVDLWLVKTVGVLVIAIGGAILISARQKQYTVAMMFLAAASALGLAGVEVFYVVRERISPIYLADAVLEMIFIGAWMVVMTDGRGQKTEVREQRTENRQKTAGR